MYEKRSWIWTLRNTYTEIFAFLYNYYVIWTEVCYPNIHTRAFCISTLLRTGVTLFVYCHSRRTTWNSQVLLLPVETNIQITRYNNNQETDTTPNSVDLYKYQDYVTEQLSLKSKSIKAEFKCAWHLTIP